MSYLKVEAEIQDSKSPSINYQRKNVKMDITERVLDLMKRNKGLFLSGEAMSREIGITRSAVWKRINDLRARGYMIEASPSKGYRLLAVPDILSIQEIRGSITDTACKDALIIGREIHVFEEIDSTNIKGMELGDSGFPEGTIILAETQTRGKGRLGRRWISPKGNIYLSVILRPDIQPSLTPLITLMAAVASASALRKAIYIDAYIKWPNDIILNGKKIGGILTEMNSEMDRINYIVLGIGINVNMDPSSLPPDVRVNATSLKEVIGRDLRRTEILSVLIKELDRWYRIFLNDGPGPVLDEWRRLSLSLEKRVKVTSLNRTIEGLAEEIDDYGRLIVRLDDGRIEKVTSGDVTIIRE